MNLPEPDDLDFTRTSNKLQKAYDDLISGLQDDPDAYVDSRRADDDFDAVTPEEYTDGSKWAPLTLITSTTNPERPRTLMAGYDSKNYILTVQFRDTTVYNYYDVSPAQWDAFKSSESKNDYITSELDFHRKGNTLLGQRQAAAYKGLGKSAARAKRRSAGGFSPQRPYGGNF